jgi:hypothetical protein
MTLPERIEQRIVAEAEKVTSGDSIVQATDGYREGYMDALREAVRIVRDEAKRHA